MLTDITRTIMPRAEKALKWAAILLFVYAVAGFLILPPIIKSVLLKKLSENLHREVTIRDVSVNPFALSVSVKGAVIKDRAGSAPFLSFDELYLNLQTLSIFKKGVILKEVRLRKPYINVTRNRDLSYNFSDLLVKKKEEKPSALRYSINNIQITDGGADFADTPKNTRHRLTEVNVTLPFISNLAHYTESFVQPSFSARLNGTPVSFSGVSKPFSDSLETSFDIGVKDFNIPRYLPYNPFEARFKATSGYLDTALKISYSQYKDGRRPTLAVSGNIALKKLDLTDKDGGPVISIPRLDVSIISAEALSRDVHLASVMLDSPQLYLVRDGRGRVNLLSILPEKEKKDAHAKTGKDEIPLSLDVNVLKVMGGAVSFSDGLNAPPFKALIQPVDVTVINFGNKKGWKSAISLSLRTDAGETVKFAGGVVLDPLMAEGTLELDDIPLTRYSPYYKDVIPFYLEDGTLDLATSFRYSKATDAPESRLNGLKVTLASLRLRKKDEKREFLSIPVLRVRDTSVDLEKRELILGGLSTEKGLVAFKRFKDGNIDLVQISKNIKVPGKNPGRPAPAEAEKPWDVMLKDVSVDSWTLRMVDMWPPQQATLTAEKLDIDAQGIGTAMGSSGTFSMSFRPNGKGSSSIRGSLGINPVSFRVKVDLKDVEAASMQAYFSDRIKIIITDGRVAANGELITGYSGPRGLNLKWAGDVSMQRFASIDKQNAEDFLQWKDLSLKGMKVGYGPNYVNIKEVSVSGLYSRVAINQDGNLNVLNVLKQDEAPAKGDIPPPPSQPRPAPPAEKKPAWPVKVDRITMQGGSINFSDRHIDPVFSSALTDISGNVTGLSSEETKTADIDLKGLYNSAPVDITGKLNPLRENPYVDLKISCTGVDLSPVTPYSGRYMGYKIQKGKLYLDLQYLIVQKKLDSQNRIFIDQLKLGDRVESPDATKLPVKLAIALLRDRHGEIHLDVPVTGSTDDPKFRIGGIIIQIIWNVITKAATSPFSLLGSLFGGGEELGYVEFDPGSAGINKENIEKLEKLVKALYDRPEIKLSIEGHADMDKDREEVRKYLFNKKLKAQKLKDMIDDGQPAIPVDEVRVGPDEFEKYLKMAYKAERFPKPRNILGIAKSLPPAEMEKLMLANLEVKDDDLRQLADRRAGKVRDYILGTGKVEPARVFLVQPESLPPEKKQGIRDSRVDFSMYS